MVRIVARLLDDKMVSELFVGMYRVEDGEEVDAIVAWADGADGVAPDLVLKLLGELGELRE